MIPFLFTALAAGGALYLFRRFFRRKGNGQQDQGDDQSSSQNDQEQDNNGQQAPDDSSNEQAPETQESLLEKIIKEVQKLPDETCSSGTGLEEAIRKQFPDLPEEVSALLEKLAKIVDEIELYDQIMSLEKKVGQEFIETKEPTDQPVIRPLRNMSEINSILPKEYATTDDEFYTKVAANKLSGQFFETEEDQIEKLDFVQKKALLVVQDVSGSMEGARIRWALLLNLVLAKKCRFVDAKFVVIPFDDSVYEPFSADAGKPAEYDELIRSLPRLLGYGGNTNISLALDAGITHLADDELAESKKSKLESAEFKHTAGQILLVTDGTEGVKEDHVLQRLFDAKILLHTVVIGVEHQQLKEISRKYNYVSC